jgi:hypothetical protein
VVAVLVRHEQQVGLDALDRRVVELEPALGEPFQGAERVDED